MLKLWENFGNCLLYSTFFLSKIWWYHHILGSIFVRRRLLCRGWGKVIDLYFLWIVILGFLGLLLMCIVLFCFQYWLFWRNFGRILAFIDICNRDILLWGVVGWKIGHLYRHIFIFFVVKLVLPFRFVRLIPLFRLKNY